MKASADVHPIRNENAEVQGMTWRLSTQQKRKYEAAEALGLTQRLRECGWAGLAAKETGRVGAAMRRMPQKQE